MNLGGWFHGRCGRADEVPDSEQHDHTNGGRLVFTGDDFNPTPGVGNSFALSSTGDDVHLFSATTNGMLTGYNHSAEFGASFNGVSFRRYVNSAGENFILHN